MSAIDVIRPELAWIDGALRRGFQVEIGPGGLISTVGPTSEPATHPRVALFPGFVNAHSHAFQRALRGRGEQFDHSDEDFWSWREAMYALVEEMDRDSMKRIAIQAYREMRQAGITTVGEFHYLHHDQPGDWAFDEVILEAAAEVGIRIVLLQAYYVTGGIGEPLGRAQQRFDGQDLDAYWANIDRLGALVDGRTQQLGVVAHSIRAVPPDQLASLHEESRRRGLVFHMHVEEQPAEIASCCEAHGMTPTGLLVEHLELDDRFTAVHDTHTDPGDMARFLSTGARVCLCPLTEANLGDGIADAAGILQAGGRICLGSDSNARISMIEEMRLLEYGQRLQHQARGICRSGEGRIDSVLLDMATINGAGSLGVQSGRIEPGREADFVLVDLDADSLAGCDDESVATAMILGASEGCIHGTIIGGAS